MSKSCFRNRGNTQFGGWWGRRMASTAILTRIANGLWAKPNGSKRLRLRVGLRGKTARYRWTPATSSRSGSSKTLGNLTPAKTTKRIYQVSRVSTSSKSITGLLMPGRESSRNLSSGLPINSVRAGRWGKKKVKKEVMSEDWSISHDNSLFVKILRRHLMQI